MYTSLINAVNLNASGYIQSYTMELAKMKTPTINKVKVDIIKDYCKNTGKSHLLKYFKI